MQRFINWRIIFIIIAFAIVITSIWFSYYLSAQIQEEEKKKINQWAIAVLNISNASEHDLDLFSQIIADNKTIPAILTDSSNDLSKTMTVNFDSTIVFSQEKLNEAILKFKEIHKPLVIENYIGNERIVNYIYYGESSLLKKLRYFPFIQLSIVGLFLVFLLLYLTNNYQSTQNKLWLGMSKETAHQLGTPLSSLEGWLQIMKDTYPEITETDYMVEDVERLKLVADRFSKIGSKPKIEPSNLSILIKDMVAYMKMRAAKNIEIIEQIDQDVVVPVNPALFNWVLENLIRNALDTMGAKGKLTVVLKEESTQVYIDLKDTGAGISKNNLKKIFSPGFSTKKRGWGLGLSLAKRIVKDFHKGDIFVKETILGKGTTFRIILKKQSVEDVR